jgi:hypothetical protein
VLSPPERTPLVDIPEAGEKQRLHESMKSGNPLDLGI